MKTITVSVTQEDIEKGERDAPMSCPVARALTRQGFHGVHVSECYWWTEGGVMVDLPKSAVRFISAFDAGRPVKPQTFRLRVPA